MRLRKKTLVIIGIATALSLAVIHGYIQGTLRGNVAALEAVETRRAAEVALRTLRESVNSLETTCADWAIWDATYSFVHDLNTGYIESNLGASTFMNLGINLMLFLDEYGSMVFGKAFDLHRGMDAPLPDMTAYLLPAGPLLRHESPESHVGGLLLLPEGPMVVASRPILRDRTAGAIGGTLVMGYYLEDHAIGRLARVLGLSISILGIDDPALPDELLRDLGRPLDGGGEAVVVKYAKADTASAYTVARDIYDNPIFALRVEIPTRAYNEARHNLWRLEVFAAMVSLFLGALTMFTLERNILLPLALLITGVSSVGSTGDASARLQVSGRDEISNLGREINRMLAAIEDSERELKESEARLRRINDNMLDLLCQVDADGIIRYASASHRAVLGYGPEEITGRPFVEMAHPEDRDCLLVAISQITRSRTPESVEFRCRHADGRYIWLESMGNPLVDDEGFGGAIIASRDITARKFAEKELKHRLAIEQAVAQFAAVLVSEDARDLDGVLGVLATVINADRAYVFQFDGSRKSMRKVHEWVAAGIGPQVERLEWPEPSGAPAWVARLLENEVVVANPHEGQGTDLLDTHGVRLMLEVPICCAGDLLGIMGFDHVRGAREWSEEDARLLRTVSEMLASRFRRKEGEDALRESEEKYRMLVENQDEGIGIFDLEERFTFANPAAHEIFGLKPGQLVGRSLREFVDDENFQVVARNTELRRSGRKTTYEIEIVRPCGQRRNLVITGGPRFDGEGNLIGTFGIFQDVTERKQAEERVRYLSYHDGLTGLYNRAYLEGELARLGQERRVPVSIVMGDVNGLKLVNDAFGHHEGDRYLVEMAEILRGSCRKDDVVARWGGDEFVLVLPKADQKAAMDLCERIRRACREHRGAPVQLSIALGAVTREEPGGDMWELLREAENRMYRNKLLENKSTRSIIILSLQKTLRERSHETEEHANRLLRTALDIGRTMGLPDSKLDELALLAALHDIGKIAVSDSVLLKPEKLTEEEWEMVKKHPETGYRIAMATPELAPIAEAILSHHERWDGTGYPRGLRGEEIPLIARIIAVADAYDTMTHGRVYREAISHQAALEEIKACSGSHFDPQVVEAFLKIFS